MKKTILSLFALLLAVAPMMAQTPASGNRMIVTKIDGTQKVYDESQVTNVTFDSVSNVEVPVTLVSAMGYTVKVSATKPDDCPSYKVAIYKAGTQIDDMVQYITNNAAYTLTESKEVELGGLQQSTDYVVATLAYDKYGFPFGLSTLNVATQVAQESENPKVGYILYSDGSWSRRMQKGRTPVGIIFSTTTSAADQAKGWNHGYALALHDATSQVMWATTQREHQVSDHYTSADSLGFQTDKDGYAHTQALVGQGKGLYPAADAAVAYTKDAAPAASSGWYLPSSGQWFDICVNLGGLSSTMPRLGTSEGYWNDPTCVSSCLNLLNEHMRLVGAANDEPIKVGSGDYKWYWSSSESGKEQAYVIFFDQDQLVVEIAGNFKTYAFATNRVRPVIAF